MLQLVANSAAIFLLVLLVASVLLSQGGGRARAQDVTRVHGPDRSGTAVAISQATFEKGASTVYVATGEKYPDALAGAPAAAAAGGPVLLTGRDLLPEVTLAELQRLGPSRIVLLGGNQAVDPAVEAELAAVAPVERLWGADRFGTAAAVSRATFPSPADRVLVVTGANFPDAMIGAAAGAALGAPILLVQSDHLPESTAEELERLEPGEILLLGGPQAVSAEVESALERFTTGSVLRIAGPDRYASAAALSRDLFDAPSERVFLATGLNFPDGLAGAVPAGLAREPLLLVPGTCVTREVASEIARLNPGQVVILGGPAAVASTVEELQGCESQDSTPEPTPIDQPTTPSPPDSALPLGSFAETPVHARCPDGEAWTCTGFEVACPSGAATAAGDLAIATGAGAVRGMIVLLSGGEGTHWWTTGSEAAVQFVDDLRAQGFEVVQVRWEGPGWLTAPAGEQVGPDRLACRSATVVHHLHETPYSELGIVDAATGECGFCVTGNSGGASQVSYLLSHYGLDSILDAVVPTSGPPHAALVKGCLPEEGSGAYKYSGAASRRIDFSYGFLSGGGPCEEDDPAFAEHWESDAVDTGARDLDHPTSRVHFIFGALDSSEAKPHGEDYLALLEATGTPMVTATEVASMGHRVQDDDAALQALFAALDGNT